jgi:dihydrofolate reductase
MSASVLYMSMSLDGYIAGPNDEPSNPAMAQAKAAAGARALEAGVLDELQIHQIPVLFGRGLRLFEVLPSRLELEIVRVIDTPKATHIRYRVRR